MPRGIYERSEARKEILRGLFKGHKHSEETKKLQSIASSKHLKYKSIQKRMIDLYISGKNPCNVIGKILGINHSVVYKYLKRNNVKLRTISEATRYNGVWKGDNVGYSGVHMWVRKNKPKPEFCEICKNVPPLDLANISGVYKRDVNDFEWVCRKCHMKKDKRIENLKKIRTSKLR